MNTEPELLHPEPTGMRLVDDPPPYNLTPQGGNVTTPSQLVALAVQQGADIDKLDRLMQLQERWEANEARKAFVAAMARFKARPLTIYKAKHVEFETSTGLTSYDHAELADVTSVLVPALAAEGISHRWDIKQEGASITVTCTLTHALGHSESVSMTALPDDSGKKNKIQQVASTNTYLQRYTFLSITGMATQGQDDDGRGYETVGEQAAAAEDPSKLARKREAHRKAMCDHGESVAFIKECIARDDLQAAAQEWRALSDVDQIALWLAPSKIDDPDLKARSFTTAERKVLHDKLPPRE